MLSASRFILVSIRQSRSLLLSMWLFGCRTLHSCITYSVTDWLCLRCAPIFRNNEFRSGRKTVRRINISGLEIVAEKNHFRNKFVAHISQQSLMLTLITTDEMRTKTTTTTTTNGLPVWGKVGITPCGRRYRECVNHWHNNILYCTHTVKWWREKSIR